MIGNKRKRVNTDTVNTDAPSILEVEAGYEFFRDQQDRSQNDLLSTERNVVLGLSNIPDRASSKIGFILSSSSGGDSFKESFPLTPRGTHFVTQDICDRHEALVNDHNSVVETLTQYGFRLNVSAISQAKLANGDVVSGPARTMPRPLI